MVSAVSTAVALRDRLFVHKLLRFLTALDEVPEADRKRQIDRLASSGRERQRLGAATMKALEQEGWRLMFMLRLASPVPGAVTNVMFGLTDIGLAAYTLVTFLGLLPQAVLFVYLGAVGGAAVNTAMVSSANTTLAVLGLASFIVCTSLLTRRVRIVLANYGG